MKKGRNFGQDYFDELLERIRETRAFEQRAYQRKPVKNVAPNSTEGIRKLLFFS